MPIESGKNRNLDVAPPNFFECLIYDLIVHPYLCIKDFFLSKFISFVAFCERGSKGWAVTDIKEVNLHIAYMISSMFEEIYYNHPMGETQEDLYKDIYKIHEAFNLIRLCLLNEQLVYSDGLSEDDKCLQEKFWKSSNLDCRFTSEYENKKIREGLALFTKRIVSTLE